MSTRRQIGEIKPPFGNIKVFEADDLEHVFEDGVANLALSPSVVKLDFFRSRIVPDGVPAGAPVVRSGSALPTEERTVNLSLTLPTKAFVEMCVNTIKSLLQTRDAFDAGFDTDKKALLTLMDSFEIKK